MKQLTTAINYLLVQLDELTTLEQELVKKAIDATQNSYARYSNFHVGAACLLENNQIIIGANQENAAFPSGLCAERTAIFAAQANYPDQPVIALAIAAKNVNGLLKTPISPCPGSCLTAPPSAARRTGYPSSKEGDAWTEQRLRCSSFRRSSRRSSASPPGGSRTRSAR